MVAAAFEVHGIMDKEWLILVGLGNPGPRYAHTRHNCGFDTLDLVIDHLHASAPRERLQGALYEASLDGKRILLVKPMTFMNDSGLCVRAVMDYYHCAPGRLLVIYDDIDLPVARTRMRLSGSAGTHNGMRSIVQHLGYENFPRIRVGIGAPGPNDDLISHVLGRPYIRQEQDSLKSAMERAAQGALAFLSEGADSAMRTCNTQ